MVVKPMSMLTKNGGDIGVPTSLVVNGTRYSSVNSKSRSLKGDHLERDHEVGNLQSCQVTSPDLRSAKDTMFEKFEKFERDDDLTIRDHPSLHSPEMLSTKGHAISTTTRGDSRDELSSLRHRLASLRGSPELLAGNGHPHTVEDQSHGQKNMRARSNQPNGMSYTNSEMSMSSMNSSDEMHRNFPSPGRTGNDHHGNRSRIQTLHSRLEAQPSHAAVPAQVLANGTVLGLEKLANGGVRGHGKKERSSRSRHRQQPPGPTENLSNVGDVQMVYERDERILQQGLHASMGSHHSPEKMSNPVRQAVHEIAEKARRTRNRIHHQSTETFSNLQPGPRSAEDKEDDSLKALGNVRVLDAAAAAAFAAKGSAFHEIDDVNRIHQRLPQLASDSRDSPRFDSSDTSVTESHAPRISSFNFNNHYLPRDDRFLPHRGHQTSPKRIVVHPGLPYMSTHSEVREDSIRGFSHKSGIHMSSGEHSLHSHPSHRHYPSSLERDDHSPGSQPRSARSSLDHAAMRDVSPSRHSLRSLPSSLYESALDDQLPSHSSHHGDLQHSSRGLSGRRARGPKAGQTWFAATELQSNLLVEVVDSQFHLHKFPLLSRSGRLNRLVFESRDTNKDNIKLHAMPGGPEAFELAVKFCYGIPVELTPLNVATLRCAAEYLEMTDSLEDGNLVSKTEHYLSFVVLASWKDSIAVLQSCHRLLPWAEELQIVRRCSESVAWKACTDPHGISWSFSSNSTSAPAVLWDGLKQTQLGKHIPHDWWVEDIIQLHFDAFSRVMTAIKVKGMAYTLVGSAIAQYATKWLPGLEKRSRRHPDAANKDVLAAPQLTGKEIVVRDTQDAAQSQHQIPEHRALVEGIVGMLPPQQDAVSCSFLLRLLRVACLLGAGSVCKAELERRVGMQMEHASLTDLLIPSSQSSSHALFDIDVVQRILEQFLLKDHSGATSPTRSITTERQLHVFENSPGKPPTAPHTTKIKVAKLMDAYLAEVARDTNLPLAKFQSLAESLPESSRASDDGLYRAIDTYLKTHPTMTEHERKKLCRVMDCQRLSLEACLHAAQNERLPLRVVVQVLFSEQVKLRNAITGNTLVKKNRDHPMDGGRGAYPYPSGPDHSQQPGGNHPNMVPRLDNSNAGGLSLQESWHSARRDIKSLKQEIERMKSKFSELEHDYSDMTQQVENMSKTKSSHSTSGWTSGWRKLSSHMKPPNIFNHSKHEYEASHQHRDDAESVAPTHVSTPTHENQCTPTEQRRRSHSVTSTSSIQRWRNSIS